MKETGEIVSGYSPAMYERTQLLLSDRFLGFFLVPSDGTWWLSMFMLLACWERGEGREGNIPGGKY
jgi:hypothetical protein